MALETGVTEAYAKQVYFKQLANPNIFIAEGTDKVSGEKVQYLRSTTALDVNQMSRAINNFRIWAENNGYYLPDASIDGSGNVTFMNDKDEKAFHQAEIETSRFEQYI